jgi:hypothetical protein
MTKFEFWELESINTKEVRVLRWLVFILFVCLVAVCTPLVLLHFTEGEIHSTLASISTFVLIAFFLIGLTTVYCESVGRRVRRRNKQLGSLGDIIEKGRQKAALRPYGFRHLSQRSKS